MFFIILIFLLTSGQLSLNFPLINCGLNEVHQMTEILRVTTIIIHNWVSLIPKICKWSISLFSSSFKSMKPVTLSLPIRERVKASKHSL